jgi:hypothetical protein
MNERWIEARVALPHWHLTGKAVAQGVTEARAHSAVCSKFGNDLTTNSLKSTRDRQELWLASVEQDKRDVDTG